MSNPIQLLTNEKAHVSVTILDKGGNQFQDLADAPAGTTVVFESSDPSVLSIEVRPDGLVADVKTNAVGTATVTVTTTKADGSQMNDSPDVTEVTVAHAEPDRQNVSWSAAELEDSGTPPEPPPESMRARGR